jgi:hypothetical protein
MEDTHTVKNVQKQTDLLEWQGMEAAVLLHLASVLAPVLVPVSVVRRRGPAQEEAGSAAATQRLLQRAGRGGLPLRRQRVHAGRQDTPVPVPVPVPVMVRAARAAAIIIIIIS